MRIKKILRINKKTISINSNNTHKKQIYISLEILDMDKSCGKI